ncbi:uncharacterized protein [Lolium perenne]|uniref:uncharacterized protein isoform X3 n=1 Tax=Lolium perenne TaxID=4522 RepID=UPI0021F5D8D9|nr:uncharacterized protein LOC127302823 isoform X3 [Lolium perenne]
MMMPTAGESRSPVRALRRMAGALLAAARLRGSFSASKCKTEARMAAARMKLLRNRRDAQLRKMRGDVAALLRDGRDDTARIRVEHVIREQNTMAANEIIELFCELIVTRLPIIAKQKECPADLKEGICSLIFAAPRCSELPELSRMRDLFEKKYGKDFVAAAVDLRPNAGVNNLLIEKLSVNKPSGQTKLKVLKDIAKEHQIDWDTTETEQDLLKPPAELIQGPSSFVEASKMPVKTTLSANFAQPYPSNYSRSEYADEYDNGSAMQFKDAPSAVESAAQHYPSNYRSEYTDEYDNGGAMQFKDAASAARAAAESAAQAASAAKAAADLVNKNTRSSDGSTHSSDDDEDEDWKTTRNESTHSSRRQTMSNTSRSSRKENVSTFDELRPRGSTGRRFSASNHTEDKDIDLMDLDTGRMRKRNSTGRAARKVHSEIKFDDSEAEDESDARKRGSRAARKVHSEVKFDDSEAEDESDARKRDSRASRKVNSEVKFDKSRGWNSEAEDEIQSLERPPPRREHYQGNGHSDEKEPDDDFPEPPKASLASRVHPSMPLDFETLTARFEALRSGKLP